MQTRRRQIKFTETGVEKQKRQIRSVQIESQQKRVKNAQDDLEPPPFTETNSENGSAINPDMNDWEKINQCVIPLSDIEIQILAEFLNKCSPFLHSVIQNVNSYHSQCERKQVTPVKHLSIDRVRKMANSILVEQTDQANFPSLLHPDIYMDQELMKQMLSSKQLLPPVVDLQVIQIDLGNNLTAESLCDSTNGIGKRDSLSTSHFSLSDESLVLSNSLSHPTLYSSNIPQLIPEQYDQLGSKGAMYMDEVGLDQDIQMDGLHRNDRRHERKWCDLSCRELAFFIAMLLREGIVAIASENEMTQFPTVNLGRHLLTRGFPSQSGDGSTCFSELHGISRDRWLQLRRTLAFPDIELENDEIIDKYCQNMMKETSTNQQWLIPLSQSLQSIDRENCMFIINQYLIDSDMTLEITQSLNYLHQTNVQFDEQQINMLKILRKTHREPEVLLWFTCQLFANAAYRNICSSQLGGDSLSIVQFMGILVKGLIWMNMAPINELVQDDTHYLVRIKRKDCKQLERRQCCCCSPRGSLAKKRTEFFCMKCQKPFCNADECFGRYHHSNDLKYYRYVNTE